MAKVALYEHGEGKKTLRLNKYYKTDYSSANLLSSVPLGVLTGILIVALIFLVDVNWVVKVSEKLGGTLAVIVLAAAFILFVAGYCFFALYMFNHKYDRFRGNLRTYGLNLRRLKNVYEEERNAAEAAMTRKTNDEPDKVQK